jgi:hypothetical protein
MARDHYPRDLRLLLLRVTQKMTKAWSTGLLSILVCLESVQWTVFYKKYGWYRYLHQF